MKVKENSSPTKQNSEFMIDWVTPSITTLLRDGSPSNSKGDFAMKLTALVEAGGSTGYLALVKRHLDGKEK